MVLDTFLPFLQALSHISTSTCMHWMPSHSYSNCPAASGYFTISNMFLSSSRYHVAALTATTVLTHYSYLWHVQPMFNKSFKYSPSIFYLLCFTCFWWYLTTRRFQSRCSFLIPLRSIRESRWTTYSVLSLQFLIHFNFHCVLPALFFRILISSLALSFHFLSSASISYHQLVCFLPTLCISTFHRAISLFSTHSLHP